MDDSCAVCAETLEWVAYGACGHREVCSTCVIRLRFVCDDRQCCICKSESNIIFITKALGDYTRMINDFSVFPHNPTEGQVGLYWYHGGTEAYFDDLDHYKMIEAMCKLSCSVCDRMAEQNNQGSKRRGQFKNMEQLKSHLFQRHKLLMCSLCLESRKVFICEQKLYTRSQLDQHTRTGDSEVDGNECERGGFTGHPMCDFCLNPFYGDNELYLHMSTEHYTCHICLRQHPGQYEYYKNYDDLEIHFRQQHFLCEDEDCLAKKFIVFATTSEMKRHNAMEHGGNMSRAKRAAALQIPTSFLYRRSNEQDRRRSGHDFRRNLSDYQLSLAIEANHETANVERFRATASPVQQETVEINSIVNPFELLATTESEASSRSCQATGQNSGNLPLTESSFPPLPITSSRTKQKSRNNSEVSGRNTMAARIHRRNNGAVTVLNVGKGWQAASRQPASTASSSSLSRPAVNSGLSSSGLSIPSESKPAAVNEYVPAHNASPSQLRPGKARGPESANPASSSRNSTTAGMVDRTSLVLNLAERGALDPSMSNFPPFSAIQNIKLPTSKVEYVHTDNKSLVEKIHAAFDFDKDKYSAFKEISSEYRRGVINSGEYLAYVYQFGLTHLVLELARLCPDAQKQKELIEIYNFNMRNGSYGNSLGNDSGQLKNKKDSRKGKEKCKENGIDGSEDSLAVNIVSRQKKLHSMLSEQDVEVLSKDGYRSAKGKSKVSLDSEQISLSSANQSQTEPNSQTNSQTPSGGLKKSQQTGGGGNQQRKKIPKFLTARLGDNSAAALIDNDKPGPDQTEEKTHEKYDSIQGLPVHGVWRNRGGQKLAITQRRLPK